MKARITVVTLGVADLNRSRKFYCEGLGWRASSTSNDHITFIDTGGIVLALYPRELLAKDAKVDPNGSGFSGIALAHNVASTSEVDEGLEAAQKAGAKILKPAETAFWGGYSGYFADPDGFAWEVAYNPHWQLDADGRVVLPE